MPKMTKHDRTITTTETYYTLEISEQERAELVRALGPLRRDAVVTPVYRALRDAKDQTAESVQSTPLAVGDKVRVLEDDSECRTGEFVGKVGRITRISEHHSSRLPYSVKFDADQGAPYSAWNVARVEKVEASPEPKPLAVGDRLRITSELAGAVDDRVEYPGPFEGGELVTVRSLADSDGDLKVDRTRGATWDYLAESGPNAQWERVETSAPLAVGDTIVILQDEAAGADVRTGDRLTVTEVKVLSGDRFRTEAPRADYAPYWTFRYSAEGRHWKRVG